VKCFGKLIFPLSLIRAINPKHEAKREIRRESIMVSLLMPETKIARKEKTRNNRKIIFRFNFTIFEL